MKRLLPLVLLAPLGTAALDFEFDNGVSLSLDSTLTVGAQWRIEDRDDGLTGNAFRAALLDDPLLPLTRPEFSQDQTLLLNSDDGNNNFDTGLISNRYSFLVDAALCWEASGAFFRARSF